MLPGPGAGRAKELSGSCSGPQSCSLALLDVRVIDPYPRSTGLGQLGLSLILPSAVRRRGPRHRPPVESGRLSAVTKVGDVPVRPSCLWVLRRAPTRDGGLQGLIARGPARWQGPKEAGGGIGGTQSLRCPKCARTSCGPAQRRGHTDRDPASGPVSKSQPMSSVAHGCTVRIARVPSSGVDRRRAGAAKTELCVRLGWMGVIAGVTCRVWWHRRRGGRNADHDCERLSGP
jgi:hypothetical protein